MTLSSSLKGLQPSGKFMFLLGLFLISIAVASILQVAIILPFSNLKSLTDLASLNDFSDPNLITGMKIAQAVSVLFMFIIPAFFFAYLTSEQKIYYLKINKGFPVFLATGVILLVFSVMPFINWAGEINSHLSLPSFMSNLESWMKSSEESAKKLTDAFLQMDGIADLIVNIIVIALLAAMGEELFFRGCMQNIVVEWIKNKHVGIWITAIIFSASHMQFYGFLPRMFLGVVLGYLYIWSGSLWLSMLFHFLNNGLAVLFSYLISKGTISESAETIGAGESPIYLALISAIVSIGMMYFVYRNSLKSEL